MICCIHGSDLFIQYRSFVGVDIVSVLLIIFVIFFCADNKYNGGKGGTLPSNIHVKLYDLYRDIDVCKYVEVLLGKGRNENDNI